MSYAGTNKVKSVSSTRPSQLRSAEQGTTSMALLDALPQGLVTTQRKRSGVAPPVVLSVSVSVAVPGLAAEMVPQA